LPFRSRFASSLALSPFSRVPAEARSFPILQAGRFPLYDHMMTSSGRNLDAFLLHLFGAFAASSAARGNAGFSVAPDPTLHGDVVDRLRSHVLSALRDPEALRAMGRWQTMLA